MGTAVIGFGANLGAPEQKYLELISRLHAFPGIRVMGACRLFQTNPVGGPPVQPRYHNGAILLEVDLPPLELFAVLQTMESLLGRVRGDHWGPREIDLDLLLYNDLQSDVCISSEALTLPHPRFHFRRFALAPANELAGDMFHPIFQFTVSELLSHLDRVPRIVAIAGADVAQSRDFAADIARRAGAPFTDAAEQIAETPLDEYVTTYEAAKQSAFPAQLVIWLADAANPEIPPSIQAELNGAAFSTWLSLDMTKRDAALASSAAAVAAMRPFAAE